VQNEPNLARPEGKCAKQTQFRPPEQNVGRAWRGAALHAGATHEEAKRAEQSQFVPRHREAKFLVELELRKILRETVLKKQTQFGPGALDYALRLSRSLP
jgi:hypothetical protein